MIEVFEDALSLGCEFNMKEGGGRIGRERGIEVGVPAGRNDGV